MFLQEVVAKEVWHLSLQIWGGMLFFSAGIINTSTTCHTKGKGWVLDISKPVGRSLQALIMYAHAQGKQLWVDVLATV